MFNALRRLRTDIYYYRTKSGREVDFIIPDFTATGEGGSTRKLRQAVFQACESLSDAKTRKREVTALNEAMDELNLKNGAIVTRNEEDQIEIGGKRISVVPAWRFLIDLPED